MSDRRLPEPIDVLGIPVHPLTIDDFVGFIADWSAEGDPRRIYNVNIHAMNLAAQNDDFRRALQRADLVFCDGAGVQWGARILGSSLPERFSSTDWMDPAFSAMTHAGTTLFLLGDEAEIASATTELIQSRHPELEIVGHHHGFFAKEGTENDRVVDLLTRAKPDVLLVGMGMPLQELWIERNIDRLPPSVFIPVGAAFRWYLGVQHRPPKWMQDHGLEWLGRLAMEPRRLAKRYLVGNPQFLIRTFTERLTRRSA